MSVYMLVGSGVGVIACSGRSIVVDLRRCEPELRLRTRRSHATAF